MKLSEIKRPELFEVNADGLRIEISSPKMIYNKETKELVDILIAPTLVLSDRNSSTEKFVLPFDIKMLDDDIYKKFNNYTYSIGKMVRLAEINLDNLIRFVSLYLNKYSDEEVFERNADCKDCKQYNPKENFQKLSFGNLRKILSCIVNSDTKFHEIVGFETKTQRKNFTKIYHNYIEDRDCFTHGKLFFLYPSFDPILRVKIGLTEQYVKYERENFTHNLMTFDYLSNTLDELRKMVEQ